MDNIEKSTDVSDQFNRFAEARGKAGALKNKLKKPSPELFTHWEQDPLGAFRKPGDLETGCFVQCTDDCSIHYNLN